MVSSKKRKLRDGSQHYESIGLWRIVHLLQYHNMGWTFQSLRGLGTMKSGQWLAVSFYFAASLCYRDTPWKHTILHFTSAESIAQSGIPEVVISTFLSNSRVPFLSKLWLQLPGAQSMTCLAASYLRATDCGILSPKSITSRVIGYWVPFYTFRGCWNDSFR